MNKDDLSGFSMLDLFRVEAENQTGVLTAGLLALERDNRGAENLEGLMRAAHSLKGAARIINLEAAVRVAHVMEDCFVAAQQGRLILEQGQIDELLKGVDLLTRISQTPESEISRWDGKEKGQIDMFAAVCGGILKDGGMKTPRETEFASGVKSEPEPSPGTIGDQSGSLPAAEGPRAIPKREIDRVLRVTADNLNRLLGLASESLVDSRWLRPFAESLLRLKRQQGDLSKSLEALRESLSGLKLDERSQTHLHEAQNRLLESRQFLADRLVELEMFDRRSTHLSHRLYEEALACRMRPFADGIQGFPRMVRDLARSQGKEVTLEIIGESTEVDREVLERLEAPLTHLLRNAVDHGMEFANERQGAGKPAEGVVRLEARHSAGMLLILVSDDGRGIDLEMLRAAVVRKKLSSSETAAHLSEGELLEFLFLPGFSMKESVTEISGRGVGLDVVQNMVKRVRGTVRVSSQHGKGTRFQLQLPLTLSVVRTLLVEIGGEPYAFPLAYLTRTMKLPKNKIELLEGRQHFNFDGRQIGLITAHQILESAAAPSAGDDVPVVVVGDRSDSYGLMVDRFLGERELVVQPLDPRLGKIKDISAGALMEDGAPVLIIDVEDLIRSIEKLISVGRLAKVPGQGTEAALKKRKRVLIVDDSLTVRELERKLLESRGYEVEVAVDGMDGWNAVRTGHFNLIISDVDMPRMDGIELVTLIKKEAHTKSLPVMIVSYKDREEDRRRGLEAGADYYLTKGSFHDETLLNAVVDMIGESNA